MRSCATSAVSQLLFPRNGESSPVISASSIGISTALILLCPECLLQLASGCALSTRITSWCVPFLVFRRTQDLDTHSHSSHLQPKKRLPKATTTIPVTETGVPNNGDIVIVAKREPPRPIEDHDEVTVNRVRYQLPEDTIVLDFWGKVSHGGHKCVQASHLLGPLANFSHADSQVRTTIS